MTLKHLIHFKEIFDFKIKIHCLISRVISDSLIEYFIRWVTLKQNKHPNSMQTPLIPQIWILLSEINLEHFILSVLMSHRIKTKLLESRF